MTSTRDHLSRVAARLERGWTQKEYARTRTGRRAKFDSRLAVCWCIDGALLAERLTAHAEVRRAARAALWKVLYPNNILTFNDTPGRTQAEVVAVVRRAAERAGEQ